MGITGGCNRFMKYTLMVFNILVLLIGCVVLALGIYVMVDEYGVSSNKIAIILGSNELFSAGSILLIVLGCITILVSFCGCCGAWKENRCLLGTYFAIMLLLLIFYVASCVVGFVFRENIEGQLKLETENSLKSKYGDSQDKDFTARWDAIQQELKCCGLSGGLNSNQSWAIYKTLPTNWFTNRDYNDSDLGMKYVPESCCSLEGNREECVGRALTTIGPPKNGPPVIPLMTVPDSLYTDGCYDKLEVFLKENAAIIGGIALAALIIMVIGVIFSVCLCTQIGKQGYVV